MRACMHTVSFYFLLNEINQKLRFWHFTRCYISGHLEAGLTFNPWRTFVVMYPVLPPQKQTAFSAQSCWVS